MQHTFPRYPGSKEQLRAENETMKNELLKRGAEFGENNFFKTEEGEEIENILLKHVLEYERKAETAQKIKIFDKIEKPTHFRPATSIPDNEIDKSLEEVISYLNKYSLDIDVCSPSVTNRELYRFIIEELFYHNMDDIDVDGMITCFVYDEFHPDPVYDNTVAARDYCMKYILDKTPMEWMHRFKGRNLRLNEHSALTIGDLREKINNYKVSYDDLVIKKLEDEECTIMGDKCFVSGVYAVIARIGKEIHHLSGNWKIHFEPASKPGRWDIAAIEVEGINF
jgi:hypothetical protein